MKISTRRDLKILSSFHPWLLAVSAAAAAGAWSTWAASLGSDPSGTAVVFQDCRSAGPVTACRYIQEGGYISLAVRRNGDLASPLVGWDAERISANAANAPLGASRTVQRLTWERSGMGYDLFLTDGCLHMGAYCKFTGGPEMSATLTPFLAAPIPLAGPRLAATRLTLSFVEADRTSRAYTVFFPEVR